MKITSNSPCELCHKPLGTEVAAVIESGKRSYSNHYSCLKQSITKNLWAGLGLPSHWGHQVSFEHLPKKGLHEIFLKQSLQMAYLNIISSGVGVMLHQEFLSSYMTAHIASTALLVGTAAGFASIKWFSKGALLTHHIGWITLKGTSLAALFYQYTRVAKRFFEEGIQGVDQAELCQQELNRAFSAKTFLMSEQKSYSFDEISQQLQQNPQRGDREFLSQKLSEYKEGALAQFQKCLNHSEPPVTQTEQSNYFAWAALIGFGLAIPIIFKLLNHCNHKKRGKGLEGVAAAGLVLASPLLPNPLERIALAAGVVFWIKALYHRTRALYS